MNILAAIKESKKDDWIGASYWLLWTIVGMLPLWLLILPLVLLNQPITFEVFAGNGEFALYSAGVLSGSIYIVMKDFRLSNLFANGVNDTKDIRSRLKITFPNNKLLITTTFLLLLLSAVIFMLMTLVELISEYIYEISPNTLLFNYLTVGIFVVAVVLGYVITGIDNSSMGRQVIMDMRNDQIKSLYTEFDELDEDD